MHLVDCSDIDYNKGMTSPTLTRVRLDLIDAGPNDRTRFVEAKLQSLADSIDKLGLIEPIIVRPKPDGRYEVVAGERRTRACRMLGWTEIDALVSEMADEGASDVMLAENVVRDDLDPMDEARGYQARMDKYGWTIDQLAERTGVRAALIKWRVQLLALDPVLQHLVSIGNFKPNFACEACDLDTNRQLLAIKAFNENDLSYLAFKDVCAQLRAEQADEAQDSMFGDADFMRVQEYVALARVKGYGPKKLRDLVARLAEALDGVEGVEHLVTEARLVVAATAA